nr:HD domain-containing protein [Deefgea sp. CFH1-16]
MVAVTRPLAQSIAEAADPDRWLIALSERYPPQDIIRLREALDWAAELYQDSVNPDTQTSLFIHAVASASIVADLRMDANAVIAALLFCAPDKLSNATEQINKRFGSIVTALVEGIIKVRQLRQLAQPQHGKAADYAQQVEAQRKMLLAMVEDIRAVLIKLAWRTQTMHSLANVKTKNSAELLPAKP